MRTGIFKTNTMGHVPCVLTKNQDGKLRCFLFNDGVHAKVFYEALAYNFGNASSVEALDAGNAVAKATEEEERAAYYHDCKQPVRCKELTEDFQTGEPLALVMFNTSRNAYAVWVFTSYEAYLESRNKVLSMHHMQIVNAKVTAYDANQGQPTRPRRR